MERLRPRAFASIPRKDLEKRAERTRVHEPRRGERILAQEPEA
jgi:hypothetical protein